MGRILFFSMHSTQHSNPIHNTTPNLTQRDTPDATHPTVQHQIQPGPVEVGRHQRRGGPPSSIQSNVTYTIPPANVYYQATGARNLTDADSIAQAPPYTFDPENAAMSD